MGSTKKEIIENVEKNKEEKPDDVAAVEPPENEISHDKKEQEIEPTKPVAEIIEKNDLVQKPNNDDDTKVLKTKPRPINPLALIESKEKEQKKLVENKEMLINTSDKSEDINEN